MTVPLTVASTVERVTTLLAEFVGLALLAATLAGIAAFAYRWYVRETVPTGPALLIGLSGVAIYLSTTSLLGEVIGGASGPTDVQEALFHIVAFVGAGLAAGAGRRAGDGFAADVFTDTGGGGVETDVGRLVRSVGRVVAVELPEHVDDIVGYDPVPEETKEELGGKRFVFPRNLTVDELESRLVSRLKADYAVGHVDIDLAADGSVEYLALGSRAAGIGPTLPPATNAVAVRADPAFAASAGDLVQVWETDPMRRVLTAELRGVADDVVTLAIDAADTSKVDPTTRYRLVTLPVDDRPDREFASLLRAADETYSSVTVEAGSPLHGMPVGALAVTVISVNGDAAEPAVLPARDHVLDAGDVLYAIARPEVLRRLETAAVPLSPSIESEVAPRSETTQTTDSDDTSLDEALTAPDTDADADQSATAPDAEPTDSSTDATSESPTEPTGSNPGDESPDVEPDHQSESSSDADVEDTQLASSDAAQTDDRTSDQAGDQIDTPSSSAIKDELDHKADWDEERGQTATSDSSEQTGKPARTDDGRAEDGSRGSSDLESLGDDLDVDDDLDEMDDFDDASPPAASDLAFENPGEGDAEGEDEFADGGSEEDAESGEGADSEGDETAVDDAETDDDTDDDTDDEPDDEETSSDGGKSFAQLKAEFESGDADWEDEVSDSPGGDMRLDE